MDTERFEGRKRDHLRHALNPAHQAEGLGGLDRVRLIHEALPDLDFESVKLNECSLGQTVLTPFYVAGMTAGHADAARLNLVLAEACEARGWAMGVGSQRRQLESRDGAGLDQWSELRKRAPRLRLFANVGVSQLSSSFNKLRGLVDSIQAQALVIHANALQEALQPEGTPQFKGSFTAIRRVCAEIGIPVILKETGCGFSRQTLERLRDAGLAAVDVSGLGGTHWGRIEGARAEIGSAQAEAAKTFENWGVPTTRSVMDARRVFGEGRTEVWASGGVRTGLDAAKLIALGARQVGFAKPALEAALIGGDQLRQWMAAREFELRVALFCTGSESPSVLRNGQAKWEDQWATNPS